jgi:predicted RNA-binding Zn-ribbon protein involved in translation (DUF1610 family)
MNDVDRPLTCTHCGFLLKVGRMATCPQCGKRLIGESALTPSSSRSSHAAHRDSDSGVLRLSSSGGTAVADLPRSAGSDYAPMHQNGSATAKPIVDRTWESSPSTSAETQGWLDALRALTNRTFGAVLGLFGAEGR